MEKRQPNHKKTKDKSQISHNSQCSTKTNYAHKQGKKNDKSIGLQKMEKKEFQDGDPSGKFRNHVPYSVHPNVYQESPCKSSTQYYYESEDDSVYSTSDFFKPILENPRKNKNFESKINFKEKIFSSVDQYKNSKISFSKIYHRWLPERKITLAQLQSLLIEVHEHATKYYETQAACKELSYNSRSCKETTDNEAIDFFASFAAFVSDAASGITSFAQAVKMDSYQTRFQEIMDQDAEITKDLYASRSQCVSEYQGIEEVIKKFHSNTLASTMDKISDTLHVDKHWAAMKNAYEKNDMSKLLDEACKFFDNACQSEVLENVGTSVSRYVADNPAALEACKSTGKAVYGAIDTFSEKKRNRNSAIEYVNKATNLCLMLEDKKEVDHLKSIIHKDTHQSKLELQIEEAIDSFETEIEEMREIYFELFSAYDSD